MLDVKRHLPGEHPYPAVGVGRTRVRIGIVVPDTAPMLGQEIHAQERLPEHRGQYPVDQRRVGSEDERGGEDRGIHRPENPRFTHDCRSLALRHERLAHPAGRRVTQGHREPLGPVGDAGDMPEVGLERRRRRTCELGIARRVLRETMMREMEGAKEFRGQQQHRARDPGHGIIEPAARECGPVNALVQRAKQEIERDAVEQHRGQQPEPSAACEHHPGGRPQQERVQEQLPQAERIGAARQLPQGLAVETPGIEPGLLRHQPDPRASGAGTARRPAPNLSAISAGTAASMTYHAGA